MPLRVGLVSCAHMHVLSYIHCLKSRSDADVIGIWDHDELRGRAFATDQGIPFIETYEALLQQCDAVAIGSENNLHAAYGIQAANAGKHIACEKPLVTREEDGVAFLEAVRRNGVRLMTAFPCRFSPAYQSLKARIAAGEIGQVRAICATNRGRCPFSWFVKPELSGGGAMIDHVVHVADLLRDLLGEEPVKVQAQVGHNMYGQAWEDTAMLTLEYPSGVFATLDSSWSRPATYRTWGDVTMNVIGDQGVIELDMFGQEVQHYHGGDVTHTVASYGANLDLLMVEEFLRAIAEDREPLVTGEDGFAAAKVALAGYRSLATV
ncbi:MAG: Gfo/Idh/MocA family protein [Fimbriimonas sp.]